MENQFVSKYASCLFFKRSYCTSMPIRFLHQKGIRIDRVIECEVMAKARSTMRIGYTYNLNERKEETRKAAYKLDIVKERSHRLTWLH